MRGTEPIGPEPFDVVVLGGGIMGASTALALARGHADRPPAQTLLIDAFEPGHTHGSSHGDGRIVRFTYAEAIYLELARRAYEGWQRLQHDSGRSILETTGSWEHGPLDSLVLAELERALSDAGIAYEALDAIESRRRFPQLRPVEGSRILYQAEGAIARADVAVATAWDLARAAGTTTWTGRRVERLEMLGDRIRLHGSDFDVEARVVVVATGGWTAGLLADPGGAEPLSLPLSVCREVVAYFPEAEPGSIDHGIGSLPTIIDYHDPEVPIYGLPRIDIGGVKIGWHHSGTETDPDGPSEPDPAILERLRAYVGERLPHLSPDPVHVTTCLYTNTPDYHFVIDRHPAHHNLVIATGFSGHGFKFAPAIGDVLADLATDRDPGVDLSTFRIDRFDGPLTRRRGA